MKVYLAGPDVFRPDAPDWLQQARALCVRYGFEPLTPSDHDETTAPGIFRANLELIRQADSVVANLNPFRGAEPDSGTCFELGYALALGKQVCAYAAQLGTLRERVARAGYADAGATHDTQGQAIENFGLPLNLMLAVPTRLVEGDLDACLRALRDQGDAAAAVAALPTDRRRRIAQEAALRYLRWVADGRIGDPSPQATVAEHYRITPATVAQWVAAWAALPLAASADYTPEDVVRQMKIGGRQYRSLA